MTTYDDVYQLFISTSSFEGLMLPKNEEQMYDLIHSAVTFYNSRTGENIQTDEKEEILFTGDKDNPESVDNHKMLIIANYMRLIVLNNTLSYKNSIFTTFTKEIGVRNINSQTRSLQNMIESQKETIDNLFFYADDGSIM